MIAKDANGDSKVDIVTANLYGNSVSLLAGNGLGSFAAAQTISVGSSPTSVAVADFNGDSKSDLITASASDNTVSVLLGTATGIYKPVVVATGAGPVAVVTGNFGAGNTADAATANSGAGTVSVLLNDALWPALDAPSFSIADAAAVTEGNSGTVNANFTVSLSAASNQEVRVHYATVGGSATDGSDYQSQSETLIFAPNQTSKPSVSRSSAIGLAN